MKLNRSENETSCEPTGVFITSTAIGAITSGYFTLSDSNGSVSDYILWDNILTGQGRFRFFSDPNVPGSLPAFNAGALCTEDDTTGCNFNGNFIMADGSLLNINAASDGEAAFDPFGTGGDHSDGIRFNNAIGVVPEPMTLAPAPCAAGRHAETPDPDTDVLDCANGGPRTAVFFMGASARAAGFTAFAP